MVTDRGIAINPKRKDLISLTKNCDLPIRDITEIKAEIDNVIESPALQTNRSNNIISVVKWVDGTVIDSIYKVNE